VFRVVFGGVFKEKYSEIIIMATSLGYPIVLKQKLAIGGKRVSERRPKTYNLTTNEQRKKLLDAISIKGLSVLKV